MTETSSGKNLALILSLLGFEGGTMPASTVAFQMYEARIELAS